MASTGAVFYVPIRVVSGSYQGIGISTSRDLKGLRSFLPAATVPIANDKGLVNPVWYQFFNFFVNTFIDLRSGVTLADLAQQVKVDQALALATHNAALLAQQMANNNAQVIGAQTQVLQAAALPGAQQIPPVQYVPNDNGSAGGGD